MGTLDVEVEVAVSKELLNAEVGLARVNVGPMGDVEFLIDRKPPLLCLLPHATVVSLRS